MEEFLIFLEENVALAESVFNEYYEEQAVTEGERMIDDEQFEGSDDDDPSDLYQQFSHTTGHSAHYYGAAGVIKELGIQSGFDVEDDDDELQWEILMILGKEF
jgi:hypothetical protein